MRRGVMNNGKKRLSPLDIGHECTFGCGIITQRVVVQLSTSLRYKILNGDAAVCGLLNRDESWPLRLRDTGILVE